MTNNTAAPSLADALKEQTREAHTRAERHPVQARMVKGQVTRAEYAAWLGQMLPVWRAVDEGLRVAAARDTRVAAMLKPYHPHAGRIEADLRFLGEQAGVPLPATERFVSFITGAAAGIEVLGVWYVLEGSANGGRFIAAAISRALGIEGPEGLTGFNPHGEAQRDRWQAWRADLDANQFSDSERAGVVAAAAASFDAVWEIMEDMQARAA
ncbi:MAG: biliverdin-producing heme oxygenase [Phycisphaerae bacterium]|nr:biliverdin-producing heme oxygenase [Phycisphaerae bacterium]